MQYSAIYGIKNSKNVYLVEQAEKNPALSKIGNKIKIKKSVANSG